MPTLDAIYMSCHVFIIATVFMYNNDEEEEEHQSSPDGTDEEGDDWRSMAGPEGALSSYDRCRLPRK